MRECPHCHTSERWSRARASGGSEWCESGLEGTHVLIEDVVGCEAHGWVEGPASLRVARHCADPRCAWARAASAEAVRP